MKIKIELESDHLIDGLYLYIGDAQKIEVYRTFRDMDDGIEITDEVTLAYQLYCPSCESWVEYENWTGEYICNNCAWDSLETEAYGESLIDD